MTIERDNVDWHGAAREMARPPARPSQPPAPPPMPPGDPAGDWRLVSQDGSTNPLASRPVQAPSVDDLAEAGPREVRPAPSKPDLPVPTPVAQPSADADLVRVSRQLAEGPGAGLEPPPRAAPVGSAALRRTRLDPQLARLMDAWPALSRRTREAVLAMIDAALDR